MAVASAPQKLWFLPPVNALLFLLGTWTFFEFAEPAFWLYAGVYLPAISAGMSDAEAKALTVQAAIKTQ